MGLPAKPLCEHGAAPGECVEDGCLYRREVKNALLGLAGMTTAAADQAESMSDNELGALLLSGRWTTIEVHQAGCRLVAPPTRSVASLAHAVREARETLGLSQGELAAELGRTQGWCSRIEAGTRDPSLADLELLSHRFGLRLEAGRWHLSVPATSGTTV